MTRIVIHAGFHKTGTTSVQSTINANRRVLKRQVRCRLKPEFEALTHAARAFSVDPTPALLAEVRHEAERFFVGLDTADPRPVLMSSEDLSGHLPGRHGLDRYDAAALIMSQLADAARDCFGDTLDLAFFFSTRGRESWLRSTWWQNLRSTRLTLDFDAYAVQVAGAADLHAVLAEVADAVAPATVTALSLEESSAMPQGPLTPLLDLVDLHDVTRSKLRLLPPENVQPELGLQDVFLALNRSGLKDRHLSEAKKHLRKLANNEANPTDLSTSD